MADPRILARGAEPSHPRRWSSPCILVHDWALCGQAVLDISSARLTSRAKVRTLVCNRHRGGIMSDTKTATQELQGEILKTVRRSQETVVDAIQMWADAVQAIKPPLPEVNIPFSDKLPKPEDLVSGAYDFAEQLLAAQRKFAEDVLHATAPLFYGETAPATKKASTTAK